MKMKNQPAVRRGRRCSGDSPPKQCAPADSAPPLKNFSLSLPSFPRHRLDSFFFFFFSFSLSCVSLYSVAIQRRTRQVPSFTLRSIWPRCSPGSYRPNWPPPSEWPWIERRKNGTQKSPTQKKKINSLRSPMFSIGKPPLNKKGRDYCERS